MATGNTPIDGTPNVVYCGSTEALPLGFDFSPNLAQGETLANPGSLLVDLATNLPIALGSAPVVSGTIAVQELLGSILIPGHNYRLVVSADHVGVVAGKRLSISVVVQVPH